VVSALGEVINERVIHPKEKVKVKVTTLAISAVLSGCCCLLLRWLGNHESEAFKGVSE